MACCLNCSIYLGEDTEANPVCGSCGQPIRYCSDEFCSEQECALRSRGLDYFGLAKAGSSEDELRSIGRKGPRWDPFY
jgi:predicted amidophosphoribosyltransferase